MSRRGLIASLSVLLAAVTLLVAVLFWPEGEGDVRAGIADARRALRQGDYAAAETLAADALEDGGGNPAVLVAAEAATRAGRLEAALGYYAELVDDGSPDAAAGLSALASLQAHLGLYADAERSFRATLQLAPDDSAAHQGLAALLDAEGRRWEAGPHHFELIRLRAFDDQVLMLCANFEEPLDSELLIELARARDPQNLVPELGRVPLALRENRSAGMLPLLERIVAANPQLVAAHAWRGLALLENGDHAAIPDWEASLPKQADRFPAIWMVRGRWARHAGQDAAAARCFWEAVRREPNSRLANYHLGQTLVRLGRSTEAKPFLDRATELMQLAYHVDWLRSHGRSARTLRDVAQSMLALGRVWEAWAWFALVLQENPSDVTATTAIRRLEAALASNPPRTIAPSNPATSLDLAASPLPDWSAFAARESESQDPTARVAFEDVAETVGLDFRYDNGMPAAGLLIVQTTGGGVAAIDYDCDGRPDLYFTQGRDDARVSAENDPSDRMFRNAPDGHAIDVTALAGLGSREFGQGVTVGDYDNDGFPDLLVANLGRNQLYRNNGDGTFTEVSEILAGRPEAWTTSCLMADLDGDGFPDLFAVNYLAGSGVFEKMCGRDPQRTCGPSSFDGAQDRVFLNDGQGQFVEATRPSGLAGVRGKGLGILAADFDGSGRLSVFVANDAVANQFYVPDPDGDRLRYSERALESGLAGDYDGRNQGCMGIAADDVDDNGLLDLFVTNFYEESNTLYLQQSDQVFVDVSRDVKLREVSFDRLAFGTQFLDADLDSHADLVIANGDVDDFTHKSRPFRMRPQLLRSSGDGRFQLVDVPGTLFEREQLGRSLARLDWDLDGREDFVISHLDTPAALTLNQTESAGHSVSLQLVGTSGSRDAVGAVVTVQFGEESRTRQLMAGDGYQASNERALVFGLADCEEVTRISIRWPGGAVDELGPLPADQRYTLIEGWPKALPACR